MRQKVKSNGGKSNKESGIGLKVLDIGCGSKSWAHKVWPGAEVVKLDVNGTIEDLDIVCDARRMPEELYGKFDGALASHVLEHIIHYETMATLMEWRKVLKPGGELHVVVPSFEWAARQLIEEEKPSRAVQLHLHGAQRGPWDIHFTSFSSRMLCSIVTYAGFEVKSINTGPFTIEINGEKFESEQHRVVAVKSDEE